MLHSVDTLLVQAVIDERLRTAHDYQRASQAQPERGRRRPPRRPRLLAWLQWRRSAAGIEITSSAD